jgi:curved DNA-binding protein CbpA
VTQERDPYVILGVPRDASDRVVREAYYARARKAHPDLVGSDGLDLMRALNEAWAILKDPERRAAHDAEHGGPARSAAPGAKRSSSPQKPAAPAAPFAGQPAWTGAAGPAPGRPWGHVMESGIYAGWSLGEIARRDRGYLYWLRDRNESTKYRREIEFLLEPRVAEGSDKRGSSSGNYRR